MRAGEKKLEVSAHKVRSLLITTGAHLSTDALELAADNNSEVVLPNKFGDPYARVWQARMGSTAAIRRRQLEVVETTEGFGVVLDWVGAKLRNQAEFLDELWRRHRRRSVPTRAPATLRCRMQPLRGKASFAPKGSDSEAKGCAATLV